MRKCSTPFHRNRQSGRSVLRNIRGKIVAVDCCRSAHTAVNDKGVQLMTNSLLTGLLNRFDQGRIFFGI